MDVTIPSESLRRWEALFAIPNSARIRRRHRQPNDSSSSSSSSKVATAASTEDDPFDCSDVAVPPLPDQVERHVRKSIARWRNLDARRVIPEPSSSGSILTNTNYGDGAFTTTSKSKGNRNRKRVRIDEEPTIHQMDEAEEASSSSAAVPAKPHLRKRLVDKRVRLPTNFDVMGSSTATASSLPSPDDPSYDDIMKRRDRVISLADPTKLLDYETELHKLFESIPTEEEVEDDATVGSVCTHMLALKAENEEGVRDYTRFDGHALGRMKLRDRHGLPSRIWSEHSGKTNDDAHQSQQQQQYLQQRKKCRGVAIRVECWRRMAKRGSTPDCHRLELELWGEQTLEDLHRLLLELGRNASGILTLADGSGSYDGRTKLFSDSGMFFIEDTFYVCGEEDYSSAIIDWLDGPASATADPAAAATASVTAAIAEVGVVNEKDEDNENPIYELRKNYLCLPTKPSKERRSAVPMSTVRLDALPFRMGRRYLHASDGDREITIFFTDVRVVLQGEDISRYPLVHDGWTSSSSQPDCAGCEQRPATMMTYQNELTNGVPTPLCEQCFRMLHYDKDGKVRPGAGGKNMRVFPLSMVMEWDDCWVSSEKPEEPF